ncbi:hypothetical protein BG262_03650 [Floricoccus penangensis]|uniref:DUF3784 domain-containing protein n=1 Tax=Floricoccus penangensis TaxID=1859475 RepID=A0A9Q5NZU0_9LACT|nr:DUF3784 domain-containing protein [Floricoccus penangensis]OFI46895.1 hypothetical protein BG262_03650 [Floricoccus penangensis]
MIFILILGLLFIILAIQFRRGKWSRLIAGNTFGDRPKEKVDKAAKTVSNLLIYIGLEFIISYFLDVFIKKGAKISLIGLIPIIIYAFYMIFVYLKAYLKNEI